MGIQIGQITIWVHWVTTEVSECIATLFGNMEERRPHIVGVEPPGEMACPKQVMKHCQNRLLLIRVIEAELPTDALKDAAVLEAAPMTNLRK